MGRKGMVMHKQLEDYLKELAVALSPLPEAKRNEELRETRQHLLNAVVVNREFGQSEEEAAHNAVGAFGTSIDLGEHIVSVWRRGVALDRRNFWSATNCTVALSLIMMVLTTLSMHVYFNRFGTAHYPAWKYPVADFLFFLSWAVQGAIVGALFPKTAVKATMIGMAIFGTLFITLTVCGAHVNHYSRIIQEQEIYAFVTLGFTPQVISTVLAAWIGSRWRKARGRAARAG